MTVATESFPAEATFDDALISVQHQSYTLIDSGCTAAIAGREWLEKIAEKLKHYHLQPIREDTYQSLTGLGGAKRESHRKWILPIGISGKLYDTGILRDPREHDWIDEP